MQSLLVDASLEEFLAESLVDIPWKHGKPSTDPRPPVAVAGGESRRSQVKCEAFVPAAAVGLLMRSEPLLLRRCLCDALTLGELLPCLAVCKGWHRLATGASWVQHCVSRGNVAAEERHAFWRRCAGVPALAAKLRARIAVEEGIPELDEVAVFQVLSQRSLGEGKVAEIERDVHRTFPTHPKFKGAEGAAARAGLTSILRAFVATEPDVGYCQGMNFVAATLLLHLGAESDAFWMLLAVVDGCHFRHIWSPGVPLLPLRLFQFSGLVREHMPKLWRHFRDECFSLDIFAQQCMLTLFAYSVEPELLKYAYDVFFYVGWKAVFQIGLGLLGNLESTLLTMSIEDISAFMHKCRKQSATGGDAAVLLERLLRYDVTDAALEGLQADFQLERWEMVLQSACNSPDEPLPTGLERSRDSPAIILNAGAFNCCNAPAWQQPLLPPPIAFQALRSFHEPFTMPPVPRWSPRCLSEDEAETEKRLSLRAAAREVAREVISGLVSPALQAAPTEGQPRPAAGERGTAGGSALGSELQRVRQAFFGNSPLRGAAEALPTLLEEQESTAEPSARTGPQEVPTEQLRKLKAKLDEFDAETQRDVAQLRVRTDTADRQLQACLRSSENLRAEVQQLAVEKQEWQQYKWALMDSLNTAVQTSGMARKGDTEADASGGSPKPHQDGLVLQCLEKLKSVEASVFHVSLKWQAKVQEIGPIADQLTELREFKARSIGQLNDFLAARTEARKGVLAASLSSILPTARRAVPNTLISRTSVS